MKRGVWNVLLKNLHYSLMLLFILSIAGTVFAQVNPAQKANYKLANRFTRDKVGKLIHDTSVRPHWIKDSEKCWYRFKKSTGTFFYLVDPVNKTKAPVFDNAKMAAALSEALKKPYDPTQIPLKTIKFIKDLKAIEFEIDSLKYEWNLAAATLTFVDSVKAKPKTPKWVYYSPDSVTIVFARNHNLFIMARNDPDSVEHQLTADGEKYYSYASDDSDTSKTERKRARVRWFKDSKKFYKVRQDRRKVGDLWVIDELKKPRPILKTYKYPMPGEKNIPQDELYIFDVDKKSALKIKTEKWKDQSLGGAYFGTGGLYVPHKKSDKLYFMRRNRAWNKIDLCVVNTETGDVKELINEDIKPYINTRYSHLAILNEGKDLIWWSERDGWGHYYLYGENGKLKKRLTSGTFVCQGITKIDTTGRVMYFRASGREKGEDPYYVNLYKINLDGTGFKLLTPENANHRSNVSDTRKYFVNTYSTVNQAPKADLRDNTGKVILNLENVDISRLEEAGWKMPETFVVKADDGITDLYGVMWKPFDFDPKKKYPIITYVYPGPQTEAVPKSFSANNRNVALAQLGFVVVAFGNRGGSPQRSKWYHNYGYDNLRDYGLADKKAGLEQLAARFPFIDIDKVGIYGHSGGGFMSTAAMLVYPDFFKAAVSSAGNHDNNMYNIWWSEVHHGVKEKKVKKKKDGKKDEKNEKKNEEKKLPDEDEYEIKFSSRIPTNPELAKNLKGHLLLVHGSIDNNVHPGNTIRMVDALIKAKKKFDFMLLPGQRHGFGKYTDYFNRLLWDYFSEHLIGDYRTNVDLMGRR